MLKNAQLALAAGTLILGALALPPKANAEEVTVTLSVPGMNCPACPITVRRSIEQVEGVLKAETFIETRTAVVTFDDTRTNVQALTEATEWYGYPSTVVPGDS